MTEFYFVRHGQTVVNLEHKFNGGLTNKPLTEEGRQRAKLAGQGLAAVHFTQVLTSSMPRAVKTAELIMGENQFRDRTPVKAVDGLREMIMGQWDGLSEEEINDPAAVNRFRHDILAFDAQDADRIGAEKFSAVVTRSLPVIDAAFHAYPQGTILVVGHGALYRVLLNALTGHPLADAGNARIVANSTITRMTTLDGQHFDTLMWGVEPEDYPAAAAALNRK